MTRTVLPASTFPDVLIANGTTYVALPTSLGLDIDIDFGHGIPVAFDHRFPIGSWPRLFAHAMGILCAYKTGDDECLTVANITTGQVTRTGIPAFWNSPICWRDDGLLCVQATTDAQVWSGVWPALPAPPALRQGVGTGLAQWDGPNLMTWDEINQVLGPSSGSQPVIFSGLRTVGQANIGGIQVSIPTDGAEGVIAPGTYTNDPRPALAADGSISIVHWVQGSHGTLETVLYQGVTAADLKPAPPSYPVTPLTKPTICANFQHFTNPLSNWSNAWIDMDQGGSGKQVLIGNIPGTGFVRWNVFDLESMTGDRTSPCCYIGALSMFLNSSQPIAPTKADILSPWFYPDQGETAKQFEDRARGGINVITAYYPGIPIAPIWRVDTRIGPNGPTLTEAQVLECLSIASTEFPGLPALFFQGDRAGFVSSAVPMLEKWRNGQPCSVPIEPVPPTQPGLAARKILLCRR